VRILRIWVLISAALAMASPLAARDTNTPKPERGQITGTVTDGNGDTLSGATVVLAGPVLTAPRTLQSNDSGFFAFADVDPGTYSVSVTARGFSNWTSSDIIVNPGQYVILPGCELKITTAMTSVSVSDSTEEIATEQVKAEEQQRVLGIFPNFYVVYDQDAAPLTTKLKFHLALKVSSDPVTVAGVGFLAGINQAADVPNYGQGWRGYGERFGASSADGLSDIMIGGAILPSLLHQDPRYFYQGTGSNRSRFLHALSSPFVCKGDNGRFQPNYSSVGGDLASSALSSAYYPASNRGAGLVFENLTINTGERILSSLLQEFVLHRNTSRAKNKNPE
jgi:Carboxypeptidase regulatory-like domain